MAVLIVSDEVLRSAVKLPARTAFHEVDGCLVLPVTSDFGPTEFCAIVMDLGDGLLLPVMFQTAELHITPHTIEAVVRLVQQRIHLEVLWARS